jgi:hypothetical protein
MDERKIKRLLISLGVAIVLILIAKSLMIEAATNLGAAAEKKRSAAVQQVPASAPEIAEPIEILPASDVPQTEVAASAVEATNH